MTIFFTMQVRYSSLFFKIKIKIKSSTAATKCNVFNPGAILIYSNVVACFKIAPGMR